MTAFSPSSCHFVHHQQTWGNAMNMLTRLLVVAVLLMPLTACNKKEAPQAAEPVAVALPSSDQQKDWVAYLNYKLLPYMDGINSSPFVYFLPSASTEDFEGLYGRQLDKLKEDLGRGIIQGNMLVFASPAPDKEVEMIEAAFPAVPQGTMKGVKVVFIGPANLNDRVKAAVTPAGVNYIFVEAK